MVLNLVISQEVYESIYYPDSSQDPTINTNVTTKYDTKTQLYLNIYTFSMHIIPQSGFWLFEIQEKYFSLATILPGL